MEKYGDSFKELPLGAVSMYAYCDRVSTGLKQLMAGERKFALKHVTRDDIVSLTKEAAEVTGIPYVMDSDKEAIDKILG